jgi:hypothetical protein
METRIETDHESRHAEDKTGLEEMKATDLEANPEEIEVVVEHREVPNEEVAVETFDALKGRTGNQQLTMGYPVLTENAEQGRCCARNS